MNTEAGVGSGSADGSDIWTQLKCRAGQSWADADDDDDDDTRRHIHSAQISGVSNTGNGANKSRLCLLRTKTARSQVGANLSGGVGEEYRIVDASNCTRTGAQSTQLASRSAAAGLDRGGVQSHVHLMCMCLHCVTDCECAVDMRCICNPFCSSCYLKVSMCEKI